LSGVFLIQSDGTLSELVERPYDTEEVLQRLLEQYPRLLAGDLIDPEAPRRWLLVARELPLASAENGAGRWAVDHLFLDQDGIPTVVEVKRSSDTRIRREVLGQIIEYAANAVVYWPVESLKARFEQRCVERAADPIAELATLCGPDGDVESFWSRVQTNLQAGRIRLILVADVIPSELRRMVEFLNSQMDPAEILAVEVRQFVSGNLRTMVPRVFGQTEQARTRHGVARSVGGSQWDEKTFFEALEERDPVAVPIARGLLAWVRPLSKSIYWGRGTRWGSCVPIVSADGKEYTLFNMWVGANSGIEFHFQYHSLRPPFDNVGLRRDFLNRLNEIPGVSLDESVMTRRPSIATSVLGNPTGMEKFKAAFEWFIEQVRRPQDAAD
jgi:hypothetical protein